MSRAGRARKQGARYPDGRLKPQTAPEYAPSQIKRVMNMALIGAADWRLGTMLGWMLMGGMINPDRASAGWSYAKLKGSYDFEMGFPARSARSPAYGQGYRAFAKERQAELEDMADIPAPLYETDDERAIRIEALRARYNTARNALEARGLYILGVVDRCCLDDMKPLYEEMRALEIGLDAYADAMDRRPARGERKKAVAA